MSLIEMKRLLWSKQTFKTKNIEEELSFRNDKIQLHEYRRKPTTGKPKYRLEVLNQNGDIADIVHIGEIGYILILQESVNF